LKPSMRAPGDPMTFEEYWTANANRYASAQSWEAVRSSAKHLWETAQNEVHKEYGARDYGARECRPLTTRGRLDQFETLVRIADDPRHSLESRLLAENAIFLRSIKDQVSASRDGNGKHGPLEP